jgi:hypothetical protein
MTTQRIEKNVLDASAMSRVISIFTPTALRAAKMNPVHSFVTRPPIASLFLKSFHQKRSIPVQSFSISRQAMSGERKNFAGQAPNGYEK